MFRLILIALVIYYVASRLFRFLLRIWVVKTLRNHSQATTPKAAKKSFGGNVFVDYIPKKNAKDSPSSSSKDDYVDYEVVE